MRKSRLNVCLKEVDQTRLTPAGLVRPTKAEPANQTESYVQVYVALFTKLAPNKKRKNKSFSDGVLRVIPGASCVLVDEV